MANSNYFNFTHGGTQYGAPGTPAGYPNPQSGYVTNPAQTYGQQRAPGYDQAAYQAAATQGTYATTAQPTYDYGYGRAAQTYDTSKTYYQQAGAAAGYAAAPTYDTSATAKAAVTTYTQPPIRTIQPKVSQYATPQTYAPQTTGYSQPVTTATAKQQTTNTSTYTNYDAALYSAATMYVAQQNNKTVNPNQQGVWQGYNNNNNNSNNSNNNSNKKGNAFKARQKVAPKPQQIHYCDVCKISCAGPQTYREHLEGQKHKKREALLKTQTDPQAVAITNNRGPRGSNCLHCELCDVTCTGNDAYAAHVRGSKHQKVVKLHTKLGKPIPSAEPTPLGVGTAGESKDKDVENGVEDDHMLSEDIKPVGDEYIEEIKDDDGKIVTFNCKLCECKFNDPNAKEMHMKGRRHRLQYKKKVQPDLVVDVKPTLRQRKMAEREKQRAAMHEEYWNRRRMNDGGDNMDEEERVYWEERRRFDDECEFPWRGGNFPMRRLAPLMGFPLFNVMNGRRIESADDRHVVARHAEIYPKEDELQTIQRIVSHTERALKLVSDAMTEIIKPQTVASNVTPVVAAVPVVAIVPVVPVVPVEQPKDGTPEITEGSEESVTADGENKNGITDASADVKEGKSSDNKENGNQMISFQKDTEGSMRLLKGVMRVGLLAKGLLLQGDNVVQLVVLCAEKPTSTVLKRVVNELPIQLKKISEEHKYTVTMAPVEGAILVSDGTITVKVSLTSPLLREPQDPTSTTETVVPISEDLLPREPCLQALAALRHAKWFQARATGLQSCVMIMRILRDMCQRIPTFMPLNQWALELLTEKIISSAGMPLSPGDCLRRVMEALSCGILIQGPGLLDPCEKEPVDALIGLTKQQREDITVTAQQFLRFIAFRQIHKVLGMDALPPPKFQGNRQWRFNSRKRRRSGTENSEGDGQKMVKKDDKPEGTVVEVAPKSDQMDTDAK